MMNLLNGFHDVVLDCFFHIHDATDILMFVIAVNGTAKDQLQHPTELALVTSLRCNDSQQSTTITNAAAMKDRHMTDRYQEMKKLDITIHAAQ